MQTYTNIYTHLHALNTHIVAQSPARSSLSAAHAETRALTMVTNRGSKHRERWRQLIHTHTHNAQPPTRHACKHAAAHTSPAYKLVPGVPVAWPQKRRAAQHGGRTREPATRQRSLLVWQNVHARTHTVAHHHHKHQMAAPAPAPAPARRSAAAPPPGDPGQTIIFQ